MARAANEPGSRRGEPQPGTSARPVKPAKPARADGQITGLAGEFFVAAELLKRGLQTSVTFGNAKGIDLLAFNPATGRSFTVQVKAIRRKNYFPIAHGRISAAHTYVFVVLNKPGEAVQFYVVPGSVLANEPDRFTHWFKDPKFPGILWRTLEEQGFENGWHVFDEIGETADNPPRPQPPRGAP